MIDSPAATRNSDEVPARPLRNWMTMLAKDTAGPEGWLPAAAPVWRGAAAGQQVAGQVTGPAHSAGPILGTSAPSGRHLAPSAARRRVEERLVVQPLVSMFKTVCV